MKTCYMILSAASILPLLSSCASYQKTASSEAWSIKPIFNVRHSTETPESFYQMGRYYQGQNRYEQALAAYRRALTADSNFVEARNGLGVIYSMQGKLHEAIEQFRLAAEQAPDAAHIHNNLGYALYLSGSYAEAAKVLEKAIALDPSNQPSHTNLALALDKAGDKGKAVQVMAQAAMQQSAGNVPPVIQEAQQVLTLPKDWGVITQKPVPLVESHTQAIQLAPNVYELRERAEVQVVSAHQQISAQLKDQYLITAQAMHKPVPSAESRVQAVHKMVEPQARAAASATKPYRIEISNGNGVTGMARKVAGFLDGEGYTRTRLTNQKPFHVVSSQVQYRSGYRKQAQSLVLNLPGQPRIVQADDLRGDISLRIVLGKDLAGNVAYFEQIHDKIRLVRHGLDS